MSRKSVDKYIVNTYGCKAEYPWGKFPGYAVYRHVENRKWFAVVMNISKRKLGLEKDSVVDVMNIKCDPMVICTLLSEKGYFPAYHMNKSNWITVMLDGSVDEKELQWLINISYKMTK